MNGPVPLVFRRFGVWWGSRVAVWWGCFLSRGFVGLTRSSSLVMFSFVCLFRPNKGTKRYIGEIHQIWRKPNTAIRIWGSRPVNRTPRKRPCWPHSEPNRPSDPKRAKRWRSSNQYNNYANSSGPYQQREEWTCIAYLMTWSAMNRKTSSRNGLNRTLNPRVGPQFARSPLTGRTCVPISS